MGPSSAFSAWRIVHQRILVKLTPFLSPNCVWLVILGPAKRHHCMPPFTTEDHECSPSSPSPFFLLMTAHCTFPPGSRVHPQLLLDYPCARLISTVICVHDHPIAHHACLSLFARGIPVQDVIWVSSSCCDPKCGPGGWHKCLLPVAWWGKEDTCMLLVSAWSGRVWFIASFSSPPSPTLPKAWNIHSPFSLDLFLCWFSPCSFLVKPWGTSVWCLRCILGAHSSRAELSLFRGYGIVVEPQKCQHSG